VKPPEVRRFALGRMREDPTVSYRALAKVLGVSDGTIRRWRDEENIPRRSLGGRAATHKRRGSLAGRHPPRPEPESLEEEWFEEEAEEFEGEDFGAAGESEDSVSLDPAILRQGAAAIGDLIGAFAAIRRGKIRPALPSAPRRAAAGRGRPVPDTRSMRKSRSLTLREITGALDSEPRPRGGAAVRFLVAAGPLLESPHSFHAYGQARRCDPADIDAAWARLVKAGVAPRW